MNNKPFIREGLFIDWVEKIYGWGVFTKVDVPAYELVETCPVIVYPTDILEIAAWNTRSDKHSFASLGLSLYSVKWGQNYAAVPLGYGGMYNHSDTNNCQFILNSEEGFIHVITLCDVKAGNQLFVSYGKDWFNGKLFPKVDL